MKLLVVLLLAGTALGQQTVYSEGGAWLPNDNQHVKGTWLFDGPGTVTFNKQVISSGANTWTGTSNVFLPSANSACGAGTPGAVFCTFSDNSTFLYLTGRNGTFNLILDSDADGAGDVSGSTGLEFCGNGCGTTAADNIFVFPYGTATNAVNFNGQKFVLATSYWNGTSAQYDNYTFQPIQGGGTNPQTLLELSAGGSSGFHSFYIANIALQLATNSVYGDNAKLNIKAGSFNPAEAFYDHNDVLAYRVEEHGRMTVNNCQLGGASGTASPAACADSSTGVIAVPASQTTYTVNTTAADANSEIFLQQMTDNSGLPSGPTCSSTAANPMQSARVSGTSFTFTLTSVAAVTCFKYWIVN